MIRLFKLNAAGNKEARIAELSLRIASLTSQCRHLLACLDSCDESGGVPSELDPEDLAEIYATRKAIEQSQ